MNDQARAAAAPLHITPQHQRKAHRFNSLPDSLIEYGIIPFLTLKDQLLIMLTQPSTNQSNQISIGVLSSTRLVHRLPSYLSDSLRSTYFAISPNEAAADSTILIQKQIVFKSWTQPSHDSGAVSAAVLVDMDHGTTTAANSTLSQPDSSTSSTASSRAIAALAIIIQLLSSVNVDDLPLGRNFYWLWCCGHWSPYFNNELPPVEEREWCFGFDLDLVMQTKAGIIMNQADQRRTIHDIRTTLDPKGHSKLADEFGCVSRLIRFSTALDLILKAHLALTSFNTVRNHGCIDYANRVAQAGGFTLHPFVIQWPMNESEWTNSMRECWQGGELQPLKDSELDPLASFGQKCSEANPDINVDIDTINQRYEYCGTQWRCSRTCPISHQVKCGEDSGCREYAPESTSPDTACMCHTQRIRGCIWWQCGCVTHAIHRLVLHRLGLTSNIKFDAVGIEDQPGRRKGQTQQNISEHILYHHHQYWNSLFTVTSHRSWYPASASIHTPLPPQLSTLLSDLFPWSIDLRVVTERMISPLPCVMAAPVAPGWIGGFLANSMGVDGY